ncbi:TonB-linked SusC/RagA family outer membrane protein [Pedobacter africanus]|uniref:TonB-linked SusC/RagA family outer membrane protein n=3 Tax=Pedobacter africanus TaxID=151894 RepID=A0ACC6KV40_9SPHI|nr:SusC/RagA family TonB-linked outer membrane protein [Pedobacter africanus]MDR6783238.1 TonB-linked SusC/RagA family outer membrane protein [Pedobacter africanus]
MDKTILPEYGLKREMVRLCLLPILFLMPELVFSQTGPVKKDSLPVTETISLLNKSQKKSNLLQSTATVYNEQLITTPAPSFLQALPGRLSGLYTRQRSGVQDTDDPISVVDFRIRGQVPIILIDGVPRDFSSIDPESIESVTILKDALSTVMFGQRSSGNIIQVTTKRPVVSPFKLSFTAQHGLQSMINKSKPVSAADFAILYNEARNNDGLAPVYSAADILAYQTGSDPLFHPNNDYRKLFLNKNASLDRFNINMQSGNETARFYVAMDYQKEGGFFNTADINTYSTNAGVDRYIVRSNVSVDLNKTLNIGLNIFGRIQDANQPGGTTSAIFSAIAYTPNNAYSIFNPDGSLGGNSTFSNNIYGMLNNSGYLKSSARDLAADMEITQKLGIILPGLWIKGNISYNNTVATSVDRTKDFLVYNLNIGSGTPVYTPIGTSRSQSTTLSISSRRTYTYGKLSLGYDRNFNGHSLSLLALADNQSTTLNLDLPATYTNIAGNATYNFKEKYFAEAALSYGGHNRFKPGSRFGLFYAAGLGWNLAKEDFLKEVPWINTLKPRISYGRTGNANVGYYVYDQYYEYGGTSAAYYFGSTPAVARYYREMALANPNATWEKANKLNIGLDVEMFDSRLKITSEYFNDRYSDLMQDRGKSIQLIGQTFPAENVGKNRYTGVENNISWNGKSASFGYFVSGNISMLQSKVLYQDEVYRQYGYQKRTGLPVGQVFGYLADGFFQSQADINSSPAVDGYTPVPGDIRYKDLNGDGMINQFDETALGTQRAMIYYGLTAGFNVKGFDLSISIQGVANRDIVIGSGNNLVANALAFDFQNSGNAQAFEQHLNRWTPANAANATYPRLSIGTNTNNQRASSFWVQSMAYLRLQNIDMGYTLPASLTSRIRVNSIRIFANAFNVYSFDKLNYSDPEGYNSIFPLRRTFNIGLNVKL